MNSTPFTQNQPFLGYIYFRLSSVCCSRELKRLQVQLQRARIGDSCSTNLLTSVLSHRPSTSVHYNSTVPCTGASDKSNSQVPMLERSTEDHQLKCTQPLPVQSSKQTVHPTRGGKRQCCSELFSECLSLIDKHFRQVREAAKKLLF